MAYVATKERAHELIDLMVPEQVPVAVDVLERLIDPVAYSLANAPLEDEEISEEEEEAVARAKAETGKPSEASHAAFLAEFGLTMDDWGRMGREPLKQTEAGE